MVTWVPQRARMAWDFPLTVRQVVKLGLVGKTGILRRTRREDLHFVEQLMDLLDIRLIADKPIGEVSGGQQQRAIIARALAPKPAVLLLDEPTVGVDQAGQQLYSQLMRRIVDSFDTTLVIVSHDLRAVLPECQRVACLNRTLHFHDSPSLLTPELLGQVFRCDLTGMFSPRHEGNQPAPPPPPGGCDCGHDHGGPTP